MKRFIVLLLVVILSVLFLGCGGKDSSKDKTEKVKKQSSEKSVPNLYKSRDGAITAKLPDGWNNKGKGPNGYSMYAYVSDNTGDIHKDIKTFDYQEQLDEVQEIKVDELPALTVKRKFMQREEMIGRTWLVYNGFDIIEVVVQSNTANWDDAIADQIVSSIKINKRAENVTMPKPIEEKRYIRPESYPEKSVEKFNEYYSKEAIFTVDKIEQSTNIYIALKDLQKKGLSEEAAKVVSDSIYATNGLKDPQGFIKIIKVSSVSFGLIGSLTILDGLDINSEDHKMSADVVKSIIEQVEVNKDDVRFVYDNWDICKDFAKLVNGD